MLWYVRTRGQIAEWLGAQGPDIARQVASRRLMTGGGIDVRDVRADTLLLETLARVFRVNECIAFGRIFLVHEQRYELPTREIG